MPVPLVARHTRRVAVVLLALVLAACSGGPAGPSLSATAPADWPRQGAQELVPIPVASELAIGSNRFLLNLVDPANEPLAAPDRPVELRFFDLATDAEQPAITVAGTYLPTIPQLPGLYRATVDFPRAGDWGLEVVATEADGSQRAGRVVFGVREESSTPAIGAYAPSTITPTGDDPPSIATISTDDDPVTAFYTTSVDRALDAGIPFLLIFSTPAFCRTAVCGPALDIVKSVAPEYGDRMTFIHVEPYELEMVDGALQPVLVDDQLVPVAPVVEWGLLTEPYIFVVSDVGRVTAKFEGVAAADEIRAALDDVLR
jgi:hypothetical protein